MYALTSFIFQGLTQEPPLSPISETPPPTGIRSRASSSGTNTRSVSAAVSDESVAGDSGVFEASNKRRLSGLVGQDNHNTADVNLDTPQVQIKLRLENCCFCFLIFLVANKIIKP